MIKNKKNTTDIIWSRDVVNNYIILDDEARITILHPNMAELCGKLTNKDILDFGCGDGIFIKNWLIPQRPKNIIAIDKNKHMLKHANLNIESNLEKTKVLFFVGNENILSKFGAFDVIICSLVLMMIKKLDRIHNIVKILLNHLNDNGKLIISVTHPCFRESKHPTIENVLPPNFSYWASGTPYKVILKSPKHNKEVYFTDIHWTLEDYIDSITKANGIIEKVIEVSGHYNSNNEPLSDPAYLIFVVKK